MKMPNIFSAPGMQPFRRFAAIALSVFFADSLILLYANKPMPWAAMIPALLPLLVVVFVVIPMIHSSKRASTRADKG